MRFLISLFFFMMINVLSAQTDSTFNPKKPPKNHLQFGATSLNFMEGYGFKLGFNSRHGMGLQGRYNFGFSRTFNNKYIAGLSYFGYYRDIDDYYKMRNQKDRYDYVHGDIMLKAIRMIDLKFGYRFSSSLLKNLAINYIPTIHTAYRYGEDWIYLGANPGAFDFFFAGVVYNGFGIGAGSELSLVFFKHVSLSANFYYWHIFEKSRFEEHTRNNGIYIYIPPKNMVAFQPKIGILF